jgi:hypothetical protein
MLQALLEVQLASLLSAASSVSRCAELSLVLSEAWAEQALDAVRRARAQGADDAWSQLPAAMEGPYGEFVRGLSATAMIADIRTLERLDWLRAQHRGARRS